MKYWAYINNEILGPFEKEKLFEVPQFSNSTLVCPQAPVGEKTEDWKEASTFPEIAALISGAGDVKPKERNEDNALAHSLKPISLTDISKEPPAAEAPIAAPKIEINKLHSASEKKAEPAKEETKPEPAKQESVSSSSDKYDPISISEIGKKNPNLEGGAARFSSNIDPMSLSQISRKQQDFSSPAAASNINEIGSITPGSPEPAQAQPQEQAPAPAQAQEQAPAPENQAPRIEIPISQRTPIEKAAPPPGVPGGNVEISSNGPVPAAAAASGGAPAGSDEIIRLIEKLAANSATRNDLNDLKNYLDSKMDDVNRKIANIAVSNIDTSIKNMDGRLSRIEDKISSLQFGQPAAKAVSPAEASQEKMQTFTLETPSQKAAPAPEKKESEPPAAESQKPQEEKKKFSFDINKILKPVLKAIVILFLLAGVAGISVFALKQAGIMDLTGHIAKYLPLPFLTSEQTAPSEGEPEQQPAGAVEVSTRTAAEERVPEPPKDFSEEVMYFSRTYALNPQGLSLENSITAIARKKRANVNGISWQAKMGENFVYQVNCSVPLKKGKMDFSFEVDFNVKTIKPMNASGKAALAALAAAPAKVPAKKTAKAKKPAPKKAAPMPAEDEEYVYEYVDEDEAEGQEEYVMPGIPRKE